MNKLLLIKNAELFQGKKYLDKKKNYFEGWYFKNINNQRGISFIPGINIDDISSKAFIQIIINDKSQSLKIHGNIKCSKSKNIKTNIFAPNIMGPFSYVPFMECNHAIISMQNTINGCINIKFYRKVWLN